MSKIQKALGRLRQDDQADPVDSDGSQKRPERRVKKTRHRRYAVPDQPQVEIAPDFNISVDLSELDRLGLYHGEDDAKSLAQQFRKIKRPILNLAFGAQGRGVENSNVVMVASALPRSGKTFCSYNLAVSIARERDIGAVLVDADVLKPNTSRAFGIQDRIGLIDYLLDPDVSLDEILIGTDLHDILLVPAGQRHDDATELLASRRMEQFVHELAARFQARAILVDTPPLLLTNEAIVLAEHMGQIVFIIEAGVTSQEAVTTALESLNRDKPINAIVNKARRSAASGYGGYQAAYYGYYPVAGEPDEED